MIINSSKMPITGMKSGIKSIGDKIYKTTNKINIFRKIFFSILKKKYIYREAHSINLINFLIFRKNIVIFNLISKLNFQISQLFDFFYKRIVPCFHKYI